MPSDLELLITTPPATTPVRAGLVRALTTVGSVASADVRVPGVPPHWLVIQRGDQGVEVCELASGQRHRLAADQSLQIGRSSILLRAAGDGDEPLPVAQIADALAGVDAPDAALRLLLERVMALTRSSSGAVITAEAGSYRVVVAIDDQGRPLEGGAALLSDTVVRDALAGSTISAADLRNHERYRAVPSVVDLDLGAVLAVPMAIGDRVVGAIYLGRRGAAPAMFAKSAARDISVIASMAIPLVAQLRRRAITAVAPGELFGDSPAMAELRELVARIGPSDLSVLICGETGTGKEVTARAIHRASRRAERPMIAINCSAVPPGLLEAELFGYRKGAFTGATADREGRVEAASGSTLFLDEVGDMPLAMQAALLRVLQEREVVRVGENQPRPVDFRLIAATHRDLDAAVSAGEFRADLLFRIREMPVYLAPLRDRGDDAILLANLFLRQAENELGLASRPLSPAAAAALRAHRWPGNVRELRATIRRAAVLATGEAIGEADLAMPGRRSAAAPTDTLGDLDRPLADARDDFVRRYVAAVIERCGGNREAAAAALGISLRSLYRFTSR